MILKNKKNNQNDSLKKYHKQQQLKSNQQKQSSTKNQKINTKKSMTDLRLIKDLQQYKQAQHTIPYIELSFPIQDQIKIIDVIVAPQQPSPYSFKNTKIPFRLIFPQQSYPMDPPKLKCMARVFHPNISQKAQKVQKFININNNNVSSKIYEYCCAVCLPILRQDWQPSNTLLHILFNLAYIMNNPDSEDPLNVQCGKLMKQNYEMYKKVVQYSLQGRTVHNIQYSNLVNQEKEINNK